MVDAVVGEKRQEDFLRARRCVPQVAKNMRFVPACLVACRGLPKARSLARPYPNFSEQVLRRRYGVLNIANAALAMLR
jgi:hypothetical protein